jgi:hypothetical protein
MKEKGKGSKFLTVCLESLHALLKLLDDQLRVLELEIQSLLVEILVRVRAPVQVVDPEDRLEKVPEVIQERVAPAAPLPAALYALAGLFYTCA